MQYFRKMGLDYGKARIGIAFSDLSSTIASADHIYKTQTEEKDRIALERDTVIPL